MSDDLLDRLWDEAFPNVDLEVFDCDVPVPVERPPRPAFASTRGVVKRRSCG